MADALRNLVPGRARPDDAETALAGRPFRPDLAEIPRRAFLRMLAGGALSVSVGVIHAQPARDPVTVRFSAFASAPGVKLAFVPRAGAAPQKVILYSTARSPRYEYRGAMPLRFVDPDSSAVVAEAQIPPEIKEALLLFMPVAASASTTKSAAKASAPSPRYQVAVLDDSVARQAAGGVAIVNLSGLALAGTVGDEKVTLKAGLNPVLPLARAAKVLLHTPAKGRNYEAYSGAVELRRGQRALLLLLPPFYAGSLEVQARLLIDEPVVVPAAAK